MDDDLLESLGRVQQSSDSAMSDPHEAVSHLLQPLDADEEASILDGAFARLDASTNRPDPGPTATTQVEATSGDANVAQLPQRTSRGPWVAAIVAIAASMLLWFAFRTPPPGSASLPSYEVVQLGGGVAEVRGTSDRQHTQLETTGTIDWRFAPATPTRGAVGVALLATGEDGRTEFAIVSDAEISDPGAVRIRAPLASYLPLSAGVWKMQVLFAAPDALPTSAEDATAGSGWQKVEFQVTILPP